MSDVGGAIVCHSRQVVPVVDSQSHGPYRDREGAARRPSATTCDAAEGRSLTLAVLNGDPFLLPPSSFPALPHFTGLKQDNGGAEQGADQQEGVQRDAKQVVDGDGDVR